MKKIYALFMTLCLVFSATAAPLAGVAKKSYPLYQPEVVKAELALDAMQKAPAATQGLQYDAEAGELIRYYNETDQIAIDADYLSQGNLYVDIMAGDYSDYLSLLLFVEDTVEGAIIPEGTYPITSEPAYNTALASQGYDQTQGVIPCAYYPLVMQGGQLYINTPMYFMQSGNIVVEHVNGTPKITINAVNSNNIPMTIVFEVGGKSEKVEVKTPLKYDATAADGALDYTYGEDAVVETTDKGFYGMLDVADATSMLALLFVYPEGVADAETTIPAGTYTISDSQAAGTVLASSGVSSTGSVSYSFFAKTNAQGQLVPPLYFPVEGTVEVTKVDGKLKVEVNGLNSNDVPVHVVYDATPAEEEEVTVPTNEELWEAFKPYYNTYYGLTRADQPIDKVSTFANAKMQEIMTDAASEYKWLGDYVLGVAAGQGVTLPTDMAAANESAWRWAVHAFFNAAVGQYGAAGTDFTEAGKPEKWGPYYLAAQKPSEPEVTTVTLTFDLTSDAVLDRMGRRYVMAEDATLGTVNLILPTFNTETASYTDASLVVGDSTYAATATFAADTANNKEVYTAVATSTDTIFNVTMTVTYPTVQEYTFFAMDDAEATVEDQGEEGAPFLVYTVEGMGTLGETPVEFELMVDQLNNIEGMIGEAFVIGTATSLYEEEGNLAVSGTAQDDAGNTYNIELWVALATGPVEIVITEEVKVTLYNLTQGEAQGNMVMVTAGGETGVSFFLTNTTANPASWYGMYFSDQISNIWYGDAQLQAYGDAVYTPDSLTVAFITVPDAEGKAVQYNFTLLPGDEPVVEEPEYPVMEDNITNLIYNAEEQSLSGGPSTQYGLEVFLVLGQDNLDGTFALDLEQSSIALNDNDLTILSGYVKDIDLSDLSAPAATAVIVAQLSEFETYEFHLTMTSAPAEVTVISITDAAVVVDEWKDFPEAPTSNYALTMTADWTNEADGLTYPVKVEVLIYDPNVAEQPDAICNVVVGDLINNPFLGGVDGCYLTITTVEGVVTAKGVVTTSNNIALDLTISGSITPTGLEDATVTVKSVKMIQNGQLIIKKGDVQYNVQGAIVK